MKINIYNFQKKLKISKLLIKKQVVAVLNSQNVLCDELSVYYVDTKKIIEIHKKYFDDPEDTDCISFPIDSPNQQGYCFLGEIFISTKKALKYAEENGVSSSEELTLYLVHGLLHLLGFDDISKKDKTIMRKKEKSCMNILRAKNLLSCSKQTKHLTDQ